MKPALRFQPVVSPPIPDTTVPDQRVSHSTTNAFAGAVCGLLLNVAYQFWLLQNWPLHITNWPIIYNRAMQQEFVKSPYLMVSPAMASLMGLSLPLGFALLMFMLARLRPLSCLSHRECSYS